MSLTEWRGMMAGLAWKSRLRATWFPMTYDHANSKKRAALLALVGGAA